MANSNTDKIDTVAVEFGYYTTPPPGSKLAVIVRIQSRVGANSVAEDYNGIAIQ